jgi:tRNA nucleotidyltransferase (CCA-adding enzyme)
MMQKKLEYINKIREIYEDMKSQDYCFGIKQLAVIGQDLMEIGFRQGREIGVILEKLLGMVIDEPSLNERSKLLEAAEKFQGALNLKNS